MKRLEFLRPTIFSYFPPLSMQLKVTPLTLVHFARGPLQFSRLLRSGN
jgi:hypothetical protein